jgi:hypothetical protein
MSVPVKIVLDNWHGTVANANKIFNGLTDEQLQEDVAPGRNSGTYLLGHLAVVNDRMLPLLDFGEQMHPELNEVFLSSPDKAGKEMPSITWLRDYWKRTTDALNDHFNNTSADAWMQRHTSVSDEDFAKEPHRNKLNVVLNRTMHLNNHLGQMIFLKK